MIMHCQYVDTCLPDYWSGHHLPHVQIPVTCRRMPFQAIRNAIREELRQGAVMGSGDDARLLSRDVIRSDEEQRANALTRAAYAAVARDVRGIKPRQKLVDVGFDVNEDCDSYMYFVFTIEE